MLTGIVRSLRVALVPAVAMAALLASTGVMHANPGPNPPAIAPAIAPQGPGAVNQGGVHITTDSSYYYFGQGIQYCVTTPFPGYVRIYDRQGFGPAHLINQSYVYGYECFYGTVTPPAGWETLTVQFQSGGYHDSDTTTFYDYSF